MAQEVIEKAEEGDYSSVQDLLEVLRDPYGMKYGKYSRFNARDEALN